MSYDIHVEVIPFDPIDGLPNGKLFTFGYRNPLAVQGAQKLINKWIKCLLTKRGSDLFDKEYGTGFIDLIGSNISNVADVSDAVLLFVDECNSQVQAMDVTSRPPDAERLQTATVYQILENGSDGFEVYVYIKNYAGSQFSLTLPVRTTR